MQSIKPISIIVIAAMFLSLGSCGGGVDQIVQRANAYMGGVLSSFGGVDSTDADARNTAMAIATSRVYDMTPGGFTLLSGTVSTNAAGGGAFGAGIGVLDLAGQGQQATINLTITTDDPRYSSVEMIGVFSSNEAQIAIDMPGSSFVVEWTITWEDDGEEYIVTVDQSLSGTDWL